MNRFGYYPEAILPDKIYRTRENLRYCKEYGIRLSRPKLGRPPKQTDSEQKELERQGMGKRNAVQEQFGEGTRIYELDLIRTRLRQTKETAIAIQLLVMNLETRLRLLIWVLFGVLFGMDFNMT